MIPQMIKQGYPRVFATNVTICGSLQAILLPPSHNAVIYSLASGGAISIAHLFLAGIVPGMLLGVAIMALCLVVAYRRGYPKGETVPFRQALWIGLDSFWGLLTVAIILGGILTGVFTPTEAGSVACMYAFLVTMFIYRECKWRDLPKLLTRVARTVGMVMIMIGFSVAFAYMMALIRLPAIATEFFLTVSENKYVFLMLINVLLLVLGTFMDLAPMLLITTPILLPVIAKFGIDPVHFGMVMLLNLGIGLVTPPVGPTMVIGCAIGRVTMEAITRELWPFYIVMFLVLMLVTYVPELSLWLPGFLKM
jgi:tripartite ATP-independent transporter DctM subunit